MLRAFKPWDNKRLSRKTGSPSSKENLPEDKELQALEKAVNDAANKAAALWISFISFSTLLLVTIGSVTHKMLFLASPVKLPIFGIDLSLLGFFSIAPLLLVLLHFYTLLQLQGLSVKIRTYNITITLRKHNKRHERFLRTLLDSFVLVQILAGESERKCGLIGICNRIIFITSISIFPVAVLLLAVTTFLPYHSVTVIWILRVYAVIDLVIVYVFVPMVVKTQYSYLLGSLKHRFVSNIIALLVVIFTTMVATFPGELTYGWSPTIPFTQVLFENDHDLAHGTPGGLLGMSNRLFLPGVDLGVEAKLEHRQLVNSVPPITHSLQGRDLSWAVLVGNDLRAMDFTAADLSDAQLRDSRLEGARFGCKSSICSDLSRADFRRSQLQGAVFKGGNLSHALFSKANLEGAQINDVTAYGTKFEFADLKGCIMKSMGAQRAILVGTDFRGCYMGSVWLDTAEITGAKFDGVIMEYSTLSGLFIRSEDPVYPYPDTDTDSSRGYNRYYKLQSEITFNGSVLNVMTIGNAYCMGNHCDGVLNLKEMADISFNESPFQAGSDINESKFVEFNKKRERERLSEFLASIDLKDDNIHTINIDYWIEEGSKLNKDSALKKRMEILRKIVCDQPDGIYVMRNLSKLSAVQAITPSLIYDLRKCLDSRSPI